MPNLGWGKPSVSDPSASIRLLMVTTSYPSDLKDWRGVFMRHLALALARRGELELRLWSPPGTLPERAEYVATSAERSWLQALMRGGGIAHLARNNKFHGLVLALKLLTHLRRVYHREGQVDLYHINWLQNALPLPKNGKPLLVTVLGTDMQLLRLPGMTALLRRALAGRPAAICPNADWMAADLRKRFGDIAVVRCVPFGIEPRWYQVSRTATLPAKWLCVSRVTADKLGDLIAWCKPHFADGTRELHLLGPMQEQIALPVWIHYHGATDPDALSQQWFPSAAGLITLSRHAEGRPQIMLEAMAAGLPIVASTIPAHDDLLRGGENGWLCGSSGQVGAALNFIEQETDAIKVTSRAKQWVTQNVGTWDDCATRYVQIYRELLKRDLL